MDIKPLGDRVVIKPLEAEAKTKGGILLPDTAKEKPQEGKVMAVGKGKVLENGSRLLTINVSIVLGVRLEFDDQACSIKAHENLLRHCRLNRWNRYHQDDSPVFGFPQRLSLYPESTT